MMRAEAIAVGIGVGVATELQRAELERLRSALREIASSRCTVPGCVCCEADRDCALEALGEVQQ